METKPTCTQTHPSHQLNNKYEDTFCYSKCSFTCKGMCFPYTLIHTCNTLVVHYTVSLHFSLHSHMTLLLKHDFAFSCHTANLFSHMPFAFSRFFMTSSLSCTSAQLHGHFLQPFLQLNLHGLQLPLLASNSHGLLPSNYLHTSLQLLLYFG